MSTTWHYTTLGQKSLDVTFHPSISRLIPDHLQHLVKEGEHLLAGQAMQGTC